MEREWNLINTDGNNVHHSDNSRHSLSRKKSDYNDHGNRNGGQHSHGDHSQHAHHHHPHQASSQSPPMITTTDFSDPSSLSPMRASQHLFNHSSFDAGYDTDGGVKTVRSSSKHRYPSSHSSEHLNSTRSTTNRSLEQALIPVLPSTRRSSQDAHLHVSSSLDAASNHGDRDEKSTFDDDGHRRHIRLSRQVRHTSPSKKNHGANVSHPPTLSHDERTFTKTFSGRPFRLIFMRHSERVNQILGPDWHRKAFRTGTYKVYDPSLPIVLPKRRYDQAYAFDTPLTARGLKTARNTGRAMVSANLVADICLSSTALRCIQTSERILAGMERRDQVAIRIEPGLFECPHSNQNIVDSFMTNAELVENGFNIKAEYQPLVKKINVPETLDEYFDRCVTTMQGIINRYGQHGGTVLVITHAPALLALSEAIKGRRPNHETFYRVVAAYPPLAIYIAEYDGTTWKHSEQPFAIPLV